MEKPLSGEEKKLFFMVMVSDMLHKRNSLSIFGTVIIDGLKYLVYYFSLAKLD